MSAPVILHAPSGFDRPRFFPGLILPDTELSRLASFANSRMEAESRRHGFGVAHGLYPQAALDGLDVRLSPGAAADQEGKFFSVNIWQVAKLAQLLPDPADREAIEKEGPRDYDLWLSIQWTNAGELPPSQALAGTAVFAPVRKTSENKPQPTERPRREAVVAELTLRPPSVHDALVAARTRSFHAFAEQFAEAGSAGGIDAVLERRREILAEALAFIPETWDGIPLGRITVGCRSNALRIVAVDATRGRRAMSTDEPPAPPAHINVAPTLDLSPDQAAAWLASRGIQPWTIESLRLDGQGNPPWSVDILRATEERDAFRWRLAFLPGDTARIYTRGGRVVAVRKGPNLRELLWFLFPLMAALIVLVLLVTIAAFAEARESRCAIEKLQRLPTSEECEDG